MTRWAAVARVGMLLLLPHAACDAASTEVSATLLLRVEAAQLIPGAPPGAADDAAHVRGLSLLETRIWPGQVKKPLSGVLPAGATAVALHLMGDGAHFVLAAGAADVTSPLEPTFAAQLSFAAWLPLGPQLLHVQAIDESGRYGPAIGQRLDAVADATSTPSNSELYIQLSWTRAADLDLHVIEPDGQVLWSRRKGSGATASGRGVLSWDSNADCVIDGWQREQATYAGPPLSGRYRVLVDTFSLCDQATAYWSLSVYRRASSLPIAVASGQSLPSDTRGDHGALSGTLAVEFALP